MSDQPAPAELPPEESPAVTPELPLQDRPPAKAVSLPLPCLTDTPADLLQAMQSRRNTPAEPAPEPQSLSRPGPTGTPADFLRTIQQNLQAGTPPVIGMERTRESHPFVFHGDTREYFRIWIVNTLLTLLTLGLYAAWAKVRKRRYLRGNTELMGHRFDYVADPRRILAGNLLVALMFLAYMIVGEVYPMVRIGALVVGLALLPWVVVRSLAFNAHNTVYRGMRFYSRQTYGMAALTYIGQWLVIIITAGLYYPAWVRNRKEFTITSHRLGDAFFRFESKSGPFYSAYFFSGLMVFGVAMVGALVTGLVVAGNSGRPPTPLQMAPFFILYGTALYFSKHYIYARLFNHIWSHTRLDDHTFSASLSVGGWLKLQMVNLGAIVGSCGLLYPWAVVRSTRYALESLRFNPDRPIEKISRLSRREGSALGETAAEFVGLDFGL
jgi:uncharacterized membrane protein YjgN (DUF898 family)